MRRGDEYGIHVRANGTFHPAVAKTFRPCLAAVAPFSGELVTTAASSHRARTRTGTERDNRRGASADVAHADDAEDAALFQRTLFKWPHHAINIKNSNIQAPEKYGRWDGLPVVG